MFADSVLPTLESLASRAALASGVELGWIELKRQGGSFVFRVFIERRDGNVGLDDCQRVSERLGLLLDVEDPIESAYTLEVSTPGLDRPLRKDEDYERFVGRLANIRTKSPIKGRRRFVGRLAGLRSGSILLETEDGAVTLPLASIDKARLEVELPEIFGASKAKGRDRPDRPDRKDLENLEKKTRGSGRKKASSGSEDRPSRSNPSSEASRTTEKGRWDPVETSPQRRESRNPA